MSTIEGEDKASPELVEGMEVFVGGESMASVGKQVGLRNFREDSASSCSVDKTIAKSFHTAEYAPQPVFPAKAGIHSSNLGVLP